MKVLDCTLRDGGYYNDWHFDTALVEKYLAVMAHARVDYVELGFRIPASDRFLGACAYTTEGYLASLNVPQGLALGVMINAKDYDSAAHLNEFFVPAAQSRVRLVRVAAHLGEVAKALEFVRHLNGMGYTVGLNLMQMGVHDGATVRAALAQIGQERALDVLYFADSLGNMEEKEVREAVALLRESYTGVLGVHAHNNLGQALRNTLEALALGVDWLDSTVAGMGRGAGNTPTELLLTELNGRDGRHFPLEGLYLLAMEEFAALKATYGWGPDLLYYLAAKHRIHPTYIQLLKTEGGLDNHDVVNALSALKGIDCTSYRKLDLNQLIYNAPTSAPAPAPAPAREDLTGGRDVLVIANGASLGAYAREVVGFAKKQGLCVLSLNVNQWVGDDVVNLYTLCNPARILANTDRLRGLSGKVLMPAGRLHAELRERIGGRLVDYDMRIGEGPSFDARGCVLPAPLVLGYALSFLLAAGKRRIYFAGLDGYADPAQNEQVNQLLRRFRALEPGLDPLSITPTRFDLPQRSLFERGMVHSV